MFAAVSAVGLVSFTLPGPSVSSIAHKPDTREISIGDPATGEPSNPPFQRLVVQAIATEVEKVPAISKDT